MSFCIPVDYAHSEITTVTSVQIVGECVRYEYPNGGKAGQWVKAPLQTPNGPIDPRTLKIGDTIYGHPNEAGRKARELS